MSKFLFAVLILRSLCFQAFPQAPQFHFENIGTSQGLSGDEVTCIYQDHEGFIWIGTHFGLNRYDGNLVQTFYLSEASANSLSGNDIVDIIQDHKNIFWIATKDGGLTRYDPSQMKGKQFHQFKNNPADKNSIATNRLTCLYDYSNDYLLMGAEVCTGIFLNKKDFKFSYVQSRLSGKICLSPDSAKQYPSSVQNWIHHIDGDDSSIYVSFLIGGWVYRSNESDGSIMKPYSSIISPAFSIPAFEREGNRTWVAAWNQGIFLQENYSNDTTRIPSQKMVVKLKDEIQCVHSWNKDYLLAGSKSTGLYVVNKKDFSFTNLRHDHADAFSIAANKINCIYKDRNEILWIGTSNGISKYNPANWQFYTEKLATNNENELTHFSIDEDQNGTLRVCTNAGIYKKYSSESAFHFIKFENEMRLVSPTYIFKYDGESIMCTEDILYNYNPSQEAISKLCIKYYSPDSGVKDFTNRMQVRSALADTVDNYPLWLLNILGDGFGTYSPVDCGINLFVSDPALSASISNNLVHCIVKDNEKNIWVGTAGGLFRWKKSYPVKNNFTSFLNDPGNDSSISGNNISGIYADDKNHLWVTTKGNGLNEFDGKNFHHYETTSAAGNNMNGIYADHHRRFWIPTPQGFEMFDASTKRFTEVNIPNPEWILKYPARLLIRKDGAFCYGAGNYLVSFYPDSFRFATDTPKVYLTDFKVMDKSIFHTPLFSDLKFPFEKNFFTINFSSLHLSQSGAAKYLYQLSGLDDEWIEVDKEGKASFTSLPAGPYVLKVKVSVAKGWSLATNLVSFTVMRPLWQRWWFYLLVSCLIIALTTLINRFRLIHLSRLQRVRNKIANDLHDDVGSALSTINLYSEVAKLKAGNQQKELKEVLDKISSTSQEMQENMNYIVWSIQPRNDRFDQMILRMKSYAIDMLQPKNIKVNFIFDEHLNSVKLAQERRKELFLIFKEAIHNITKYAKCETVTILFGKKNRKIFMEINDDGIGFKKEEVISGNGLHTMNERAHTLNGELKISSDLGKGTVVLLTFMD